MPGREPHRISKWRSGPLRCLRRRTAPFYAWKICMRTGSRGSVCHFFDRLCLPAQRQLTYFQIEQRQATLTASPALSVLSCQ